MKFRSDFARDAWYFPGTPPRIAKREARLHRLLKRHPDDTPKPLQWLRLMWDRTDPFFLIPVQLLDQVECYITKIKSDFNWAIERELSILTANDSTIVGYWLSQPIRTQLLNFSSDNHDDSSAAFVSFRLQQNTHETAFIEWLLSNPIFMNEHDALVGQTIRPLVYFLNSKLERYSYVDYRLSALYPSFLRRWRLKELVAPRLPIPQGIDLLKHDASPSCTKVFSGSVVIPDTMPVPKPYEIGLMRKSDEPVNTKHLNGWLQLIDEHNSSKRPIEKYSRRFQVRLYWQALLRHSEKFRGNLGELKQALADFQGVSYETIKTDLSEMGT